MMGWRFVLAIGLACAVVTAGPASALDPEVSHDDVSAFDQGSSDTWSQVGWGALTGLTNLVYVPAKLVYAGIGGLTGGLALGLTGGDVNTAQAIWDPSLYGDYFLTPEMIQGEESISFAGGHTELSTPLPDDEPATAPPAPPDDHRFGG
jgi:hypothetical protein